VFNIVGLLDERFEAYYEDVDFGLRCALAGLHGIYEPKAVAKHMGKKTLGKNSERVLFLTGRNQLFLLAKHFPPRTLRRWLWPVLVAQLLSLAGSVQSGQFLAGVRGIREGLRRWRELRGKQLDISTLETTLSRSEAEIRSLQRELGCDPYWRLYFSLVRSG
jgi:GT2 family glycosyltransferase